MMRFYWAGAPITRFMMGFGVGAYYQSGSMGYILMASVFGAVDAFMIVRRELRLFGPATPPPSKAERIAYFYGRDPGERPEPPRRPPPPPPPKRH